MSDPRYVPGIIRGIAQYARLGYGPAEILGLGPVTVGPFSMCVDCEPGTHPFIAGTFASWGGTPLCRPHARERALAAKVRAGLATHGIQATAGVTR